MATVTKAKVVSIEWQASPRRVVVNLDIYMTGASAGDKARVKSPVDAGGGVTTIRTAVYVDPAEYNDATRRDAAINAAVRARLDEFVREFSADSNPADAVLMVGKAMTPATGVLAADL